MSEYKDETRVHNDENGTPLFSMHFSIDKENRELRWYTWRYELHQPFAPDAVAYMDACMQSPTDPERIQENLEFRDGAWHRKPNNWRYMKSYQAQMAWQRGLGK